MCMEEIMTCEQLNEFERLTTRHERAQYLLDIGVSAKFDIVDLKPCYRACAGEIALPVTSYESEEDAIELGISWLKEMSIIDPETQTNTGIAQ